MRGALSSFLSTRVISHSQMTHNFLTILEPYYTDKSYLPVICLTNKASKLDHFNQHLKEQANSKSSRPFTLLSAFFPRKPILQEKESCSNNIENEVNERARVNIEFMKETLTEPGKKLAGEMLEALEKKPGLIDTQEILEKEKQQSGALERFRLSW